MAGRSLAVISRTRTTVHYQPDRRLQVGRRSVPFRLWDILPAMRPDLPAVALLSAMITPAVLISACGALIFSTSARLARVVDRARRLAQQVEDLAAERISDFAGERRLEIDRQLDVQSRRVL